MSRSTRSRLVVGLVLSALWLSAVATASAGTAVTRWVDDPNAGGGPSACATAAYDSIQDAIDDSAPGDRVRVDSNDTLDGCSADRVRQTGRGRRGGDDDRGGDRSGPGDGGDRRRDDNSGPGSGDDRPKDDGDNSGPGR